jgi:hypothetical protein
MRSASTLTVLLVLTFAPAVAYAQENPSDQENTAPAAEVRTEEPPPPEPAATAAPGEEIMMPTQGGLRFTPKLAKGMARAIAGEFSDGPARDQLAGLLEGRFQNMKEQHGQEAAVAIEHFYEAILSQEARGNLPDNNKAKYMSFDADAAREFSRKVSPGVKLLEEFWKGFPDDARQVVPEEKMQKVAENTREALEMTRRFQEKMDRWSRGEVKPNEGLLDGIDEDDIAAEKSGQTKEYIQAEQQVRWEVNRRSGTEWEWFLNQCTEVFKFDDAQKTAGKKLLQEYREKAAAITTKEWKAKALANRVRRHLRSLCPGQPLEPWVFRLDQEYKQMTRPIEEMDVAFHRDVVALARTDQWEQMLAGLRKVATDHGMRAEESSQEFLRFPDRPVASGAATQPSLGG